MNQQLHADAADLAALFDGELTRAKIDSVKQHVAHCPSCAAVLEDMALAHGSVRELTQVMAVEDNWPCIEAAIDQDQAALRSVSLRRWAAAAMIALLVGIAGLFASRVTYDDKDRSRLPAVAPTAPIDFGLYLASLDHVGEIPALPPGYQRHYATPEDALKTIGINDGLNLDDLPADISFRDAALITRGPSTMVQLTFEQNGELLVVLYQPDGEPVSFGRFPVTTTIIGKRKCLSAYCGRYRALCLTTPRGTFTVLGPTGNARLTFLFETVAAA